MSYLDDYKKGLEKRQANPGSTRNSTASNQGENPAEQRPDDYMGEYLRGLERRNARSVLSSDSPSTSKSPMKNFAASGIGQNYLTNFMRHSNEILSSIKTGTYRTKIQDIQELGQQSSAIREFLRDNPSEFPREIVRMLENRMDELDSATRTIDWAGRTDLLDEARAGMESSQGKSRYQENQEAMAEENARLRKKWEGSLNPYLYGSGGYQPNEHYNMVGQEQAEDYFDLSAMAQDKVWMDMVEKYTGKEFKDNFWGQFGANYTMGRLGQDSSMAWNKYLDDPTEQNRRDAETIDQLMTEIQRNNGDTLADDGTLPWISKTLANYIPQFLDQLKYQASFGLMGAAVGQPKAAITAGSGIYSYQTMRGAAFKGLLEAGIPEDTARAAANDEAVISSLIEMGDTAIDLATLGGGKLLDVIGAGSVDAMKKQIAEAVGKNTVTKLLTALGKYGINIGSEWLEEATQEAVSIANEQGAGQGKGKLIQDAAGVWWGAITDKEDENRERILEAGKGGAQIAAMMGGAETLSTNIASNSVMNSQAKQIYGPYSGELVQEAKALNPDSKLANKLQGKLDSQKNLSGWQIVNMVRENQKAFEKSVNTDVTLEEAAKKYGSQSEAMKAIYNMGDGKQKVGEFDASYKLAYNMGKNGVKLDYVMQSPSTQYLTPYQRLFAYQTGEFAAKNQTENFGGTPIAQTKDTRYNEAKQAAEKYGDQSQVFLDTRQENQDLEQYEKGFQFAYNMGMNGGSIERVMDSAQAQYLTEDQREAAYKAGKAALEQQKAQEQAKPVQQAQTGAANQVMEVTTNGREEAGVHLRQGVQRSDSSHSGGQIRSLESGAGGLQVRQEEAAGQSRVGSSIAEETSGRVSTRDLGLSIGSTRKNLTIVSQEDASPDIQKARAVAKEKGMDIVLFKGGNLEVKQGGKFVKARGMVSGNTIYVRADHEEFTAEQLARHEAAHRDIARGKLPKASEIYDRLVEKYGDNGQIELPDGSIRDTSEFIDWLIGQYAEAYNMADYTADEVFEEIVCDSMADMNAFADGMKNTVVEHFLKDIKDVAQEGNEDTKFSQEKAKPKQYTYEWFTQKPDMVVTTVGGPVTMSRADIISEAKKNAAKVGKGDPNGTVAVHVQDTDTDVIIGRDGLKHGIDRRLNELGPITLKAGEILQNSIKVNELVPKKADATGSYVLIGAARNQNGDFYVVRSVVNSFQSKLVSMDVLYAINAKKEAAAQNVQTASEDAVALNAPIFTGNPLYVTAPTISISELLENVNQHFPDVLPEDVLKHFGHDRRPDGELGGSALYSRENPTVSELQRENALLKERLEYWKSQTKRTERRTVQLRDVDKVARKILSEYQSKAEFGDVRNAMKELGDYIVQESDGKNDMNWEDLHQKAVDIAWNVVQNSQIMTNEFEMDTFKDIKAYLRSVKISLGAAQADIPDFNDFRKRNFGRFTMSKDGIPMDTIWMDLQDQFGKGFFPEDVTNSADQIQYIEDLYSAMEPDYANPYQGEMRQNVEACANEILDVLFSDAVRQTDKTFADRQAEKLTLEHSKRMEQKEEASKRYNDKMAEYDQKIKDSRAKIKELRQEKKDIRQSYIQARKESSEGRKKARMRNRIRGVVKDIDSILNHGTKERNVKEGLKDTARKSLSLADVLFSDMRPEAILKGDIQSLTKEETENLDRYRTLLKQRDDAKNRLDALNKATEDDAQKWDAANPERERLEATLVETRKELSELRETLKDVVERERNHLTAQGAVSKAIGELLDSYKALENTTEASLYWAYDEEVYNRIANLKYSLKDAYISKLSLDQLSKVHEAFTLILTTIRNANKTFASQRAETVSELAGKVDAELKPYQKKNRSMTEAGRIASQASWNNEKPIFAFLRIGSDTLTDLYKGIRKGEDTWYVDIEDAKDFRLKAESKYGHDNWDFDKRYSFTSTSGLNFQLSLQNIMTLYAYYNRGNTWNELKKGGFVFDPNEVSTVKTKLGIKKKLVTDDATAYNVSEELLKDIVDKLTPEQKKYVQDMQGYLSTVMGQKGNEVSMKLYGVKLFLEQNYFPVRTASEYNARVKDQEAGTAKIKNGGFTQHKDEKAEKPIVLSSFDNLWADHVNEMSLYHGFTLPMEDFYRVYNFRTTPNEESAMYSTVRGIQNAHGKAAVNYIDQLLKDVNAGRMADSRESVAKALTSKFKKASVVASASVLLRQFSAGPRAFAMVNPKYFRPKFFNEVNSNWHQRQWEEVKHYAPIAGIKEMGYFDTHMAMSTRDYMLAKEYEGFKGTLTGLWKDKNFRDEFLGRAPSWADECTWIGIWDAVKRETRDTRKDLKPGSEEFLQAAGERFTDVISMTQVYDSVFSRSANMRSASAFMSSATSFMAEPTTTLNLVEYAAREFSKGNKKVAVKTFAAISTAIMLDSLLGSIVYALRDDDEDKNILEKYVENVVGNFLDGINVLTYIPIVRDIWSIAQGYDVERADMTLIDAFLDSVTNWGKLAVKDTSEMTGEERNAYEQKKRLASWNVVENLATLSGAPIKNIRRDAVAFLNLFDKKNWVGSSWASVWDAAVSGGKSSLAFNNLIPEESKTDRLYYAIVNGDTVYRKRIEDSYVNEADPSNHTAFDIAMGKALMDHDQRVWEAAQKQIDGDVTGRQRILEEIVAEGKFSMDYARRAMNAAMNKLKKGETAEYKPTHYDTYSIGDYFTAAEKGDKKAVEEVYNYLVTEQQKEHYLMHEIKSNLESSFTTQVKNAYMGQDVKETKAVSLLQDYGGKSLDEAETEIKKWDFEDEYGYSWGSRARGYRGGDISKAQLIEAVMDVEGESREGAENYIRFLDLEMENEYVDITADQAYSYFEYGQPAGIDADTYCKAMDIKNTAKGTDEDGDGNTDAYSIINEVFPQIDRLPLTSEQKTALARAMGWAPKTINQHKTW